MPGHRAPHVAGCVIAGRHPPETEKHMNQGHLGSSMGHERAAWIAVTVTLVTLLLIVLLLPRWAPPGSSTATHVVQSPARFVLEEPECARKLLAYSGISSVGIPGPWNQSTSVPPGGTGANDSDGPPRQSWP